MIDLNRKDKKTILSLINEKYSFIIEELGDLLYRN